MGEIILSSRWTHGKKKGMKQTMKPIGTLSDMNLLVAFFAAYCLCHWDSGVDTHHHHHHSDYSDLGLSEESADYRGVNELINKIKTFWNDWKKENFDWLIDDACDYACHQMISRFRPR